MSETDQTQRTLHDGEKIKIIFKWVDDVNYPGDPTKQRPVGWSPKKDEHGNPDTRPIFIINKSDVEQFRGIPFSATATIEQLTPYNTYIASVDDITPFIAKRVNLAPESEPAAQMSQNIEYLYLYKESTKITYKIRTQNGELLNKTLIAMTHGIEHASYIKSLISKRARELYDKGEDVVINSKIYKKVSVTELLNIVENTPAGVFTLPDETKAKIISNLNFL
ncbi:MAG: hypothetical protein QXV17_15185 [Candidatus Micrarchaeaceae archaeon]